MMDCIFNGGWSTWTSWSSCSVSCDVGTQHRNRSCSNPYPSGTGHHCLGESVEDKMCKPGACSDGGWSSWSGWGTCSATCDGGVRSQTRTCTNLKPSLLGKSCDGNAIQISVCNRQACSGCRAIWLSVPFEVVDGSWGSWSSWGTCSATCDGGVRSQTRTCTNPKPSLLGKSCDGNAIQVSVCNRQACFDGAWGSWSSWGSCSASCGGGIRSQTRTCTQQKPSLLGTYCDGTPIKVSICNMQTCPDLKVAFTAYGSGSESSDTAIKFPNTYFNSGEAYSTSTGRFTCKIPGIYHFVVTLTKIRNDIDAIRAYIRINGSNKLHLFSDPTDSYDVDYGSYSLSAAGTFHLNVNDYVYVQGNPSYFFNSGRSFFTGVLVIPDSL